AVSLWECTLDMGKTPPMRPKLRPQSAWRPRPVTVDLAAGESVFLNLDFGRNLLAAPEVDLEGPAGVLCDLGYSEILLGNRVATTWQRPHNGQSERIILREGRTHHRVNQPRGFRYMMLRLANVTRRRGTVALRDVSAHLAVYPAEARGEFRSSDPLLERIFRMSAWTVNLCMEDAFTDCPWRERQQWLGDFQPEALFAYYAFGAWDLARKAVLEYASGNTPEGWIPGVFPISKPFNLPTWGMRFPLAAWEYVLYTGDRTVLAEVLDGTRKQMRWLARYEDAQGLLVGLPGWNFVDWTAIDSLHNDGSVQGWYLEALDASARIARAAGDATSARTWSKQAKRLRRTLARCYWSAERGAFLKFRPGSPVRPADAPPDLIGQHENLLFHRLRVGSAAQRERALEAVRGTPGAWLPDVGGYQSAFLPDTKGNYTNERTILIGSPFWSFYALLTLMEADKTTEALDTIRLGWGLMLRSGATTCWEMWDRHTSLCHGWSAAPAMILPAFVLGVRPLRPGFRLFEVRPRPGDLDRAEGVVPTPRGDVRVSWKRRARGGFTCTLTVPEGTRARFVADRLAGRPVRDRMLPPGRHTIEMRGRRK
ncbi:MAG TPA: alpha-L-rhamnosidase C-terminal domain-containing protein, partial [Planctomycetota bacterium]|nr:alpha-L-rhamnosidase C-terminal domain-containing protein [Planctomycetota bacterium]